MYVNCIQSLMFKGNKDFKLLFAYFGPFQWLLLFLYL